ncbi:protein let-418-like [Zootermopsis nevadensis]|uniref:protein let-418-like n=1 Tax=Zootermopsis nevadensis TaxID=136037 RepID=UPI000B8EBA91|nr:protein let-418-like [Zootermopsis nevadensis]
MINELLSEVSSKRVQITKAMKMINDHQSDFLVKKMALVNEIKFMFMKLADAIITRRKQLILQLSEVCSAQQRTLSVKKFDLAQLSSLSDDYIDFVIKVNKGSDLDVVNRKGYVADRLQKIKTVRADISDAEVPVNISVSMNQVNDLIEVVSNIGGIVVDGHVYTSPGVAIGSGHQLQQQQQQQQPPQQQQQQQQQARISPHAVMFTNPSMRPGLHAGVQSPKITLKQVPEQQQQSVQRAAPAPAPSISMAGDALIKVPGGHVTSSVPKTPSRSQARVEDPGMSLVATIAKLDRNEIEVVPEGEKTLGAGDSPLVDSSTGLDERPGPSHLSVPHPGSMLIDEHAKNGGETQKDDPNEDWCAVCMDGGKVVCCDKCPKSFHTYCHIPKLKAIPEESEMWQCLLCTSLKEINDAPPSPAA